MTSQIVTQTFKNLASIRISYGKDTFEILVVFEDFYRQKKQNPAWFR